MGTRLNGVVKWFSNERGYGFVLKEGTEDEEYFVHFSSIEMDGYKTLKAGQAVTFELNETEKGVQAASVQKAEK